MADNPDERLVVDFRTCFGATTRFWRVVLHPCGHKQKVPEYDDRKQFPPVRVQCTTCRIKRLKGIK